MSQDFTQLDPDLTDSRLDGIDPSFVFDFRA